VIEVEFDPDSTSIKGGLTDLRARAISRWKDATMAVRVNVVDFVRAETDRMFADLQRDAGE
jgi:hypothetical protein